MSPLERSVLATLAYFDIFDYPLTLSEVYRLRMSPGTDEGQASMSDVADALDSVGAGEHDGYRFLPGREATVGTRMRRYRLSEPKFRRARRVARLVSLLPSVRMVAVCNSLAISNADTESDIDLFLVARKGTLWFTRFVVVSALSLLKMRPTDRSHADKVCMSFFVSDAALDLSRVALEDDTYMHYWMRTLVPLYDDGVGASFMAANTWSYASTSDGKEQWSNGAMGQAHGRRAHVGIRAMDRLAKRYQMKRFPKRIREMANMDSRVVVSDDMLKFHVGDRRAEFNKERRRRFDVQMQRVEKEQWGNGAMGQADGRGAMNAVTGEDSRELAVQ